MRAQKGTNKLRDLTTNADENAHTTRLQFVRMEGINRAINEVQFSKLSKADNLRFYFHFLLSIGHSIESIYIKLALDDD